MNRFAQVFLALFLFGACWYLHGNLDRLFDVLNIELEEANLQVAKIVVDILMWFFGAVFVNTLFRVIFWHGIFAKAIGRPAPKLLMQVSDTIVMVTATLMVVHFVFEKSIIAFVTAFSAVGVIAAFGLRGLVSDIATGLALNVEVPFQIGDWVAFYDTQGGKIVGRVEQINWRTTHVIAENKEYYVIPNREIGDSTMINYWLPDPLMRLELTLSLDYTVSTVEAKRILLAATAAVCKATGFREDPGPVILVSNLSESGVDYLVRYWIEPWSPISPTSAEDVVSCSILRHLKLAGITPSYPKLEHFKEQKPEVLKAGTQASLSMRKMIGLMDFFSPLNDEELDYVAQHGQEALWNPGEALIHQGDSGHSMFVVLQGLLDVFVNQDGSEIKVGQIEAGEFFGEMSLLTGEARGATIRAVTPVCSVEITKEVLEYLLRQRPELAESISELVAARQVATEAARLDHEAKSAATEKNVAAQLYERMRAFFS